MTSLVIKVLQDGLLLSDIEMKSDLFTKLGDKKHVSGIVKVMFEHYNV